LGLLDSIRRLLCVTPDSHRITVSVSLLGADPHTLRLMFIDISNANLWCDTGLTPHNSVGIFPENPHTRIHRRILVGPSHSFLRGPFGQARTLRPENETGQSRHSRHRQHCRIRGQKQKIDPHSRENLYPCRVFIVFTFNGQLKWCLVDQRTGRTNFQTERNRLDPVATRRGESSRSWPQRTSVITSYCAERGGSLLPCPVKIRRHARAQFSACCARDLATVRMVVAMFRGILGFLGLDSGAKDMCTQQLIQQFCFSKPLSQERMQPHSQLQYCILLVPTRCLVKLVSVRQRMCAAKAYIDDPCDSPEAGDSRLSEEFFFPLISASNWS